MGDVGIYNDYYKSIHVRNKANKRVLLIAQRVDGVWQERELSEDKVKALLFALNPENNWEDVHKNVTKSIGNVDDYCTDYKSSYCDDKPQEWALKPECLSCDIPRRE